MYKGPENHQETKMFWGQTNYIFPKIAICVTWPQHQYGIFSVKWCFSALNDRVLPLNGPVCGVFTRQSRSPERFARSVMKTNSKKRGSVKIITGLTVEINTVALKAAGGRPWCTKHTTHKVSVYREHKGLYSCLQSRPNMQLDSRSQDRTESQGSPLRSPFTITEI